MTRFLVRLGLSAATATALVLAGLLMLAPHASRSTELGRPIDKKLTHRLYEVGFTGGIESTLTTRLGRALDKRLANIGRLLWFDTVTGLNDDNSCAGCHSPTTGFGDTQSIAIGIESNGVVGPNRAGPRNMRRTPIIINSAFFPRLMWNSRFVSASDDPFDNGTGFEFPDPEGRSLSYLPHLLTAQAFIPPTERTEVAGFDFQGDSDAIRAEVMRRLDEIPEYRRLFGQVFPKVKRGAPITFAMFGRAIAEFEFSLTFANAPIDRFARGEQDALTDDEKHGALLFFSEGRCWQCHSVAGESNEMFSDFRDHVIAVPQIVPSLTNNTFAGPAKNEDFGREDVTGDSADRYKFRTSPLRNVALQPTFMHNGAFTSLEAAIRHHLDVFASARAYDPSAHGLDADLAGPTAPIEPVLALVDPLLRTPILLSDEQIAQLVTFVRNGLLDPRGSAERLRKLVPESVPSGRPTLTFEAPPSPAPPG
jgi:cytochrome c peroxidase